MDKSTLTITLMSSTRWWVRPYLRGVMLFALLRGVNPDFENVGHFIGKHGIKFWARNG